MTDMDDTAATRLSKGSAAGLPAPRPAREDGSVAHHSPAPGFGAWAPYVPSPTEPGPHPTGSWVPAPPPVGQPPAPRRRRRLRVLLPLLSLVAVGVVGNALTDDEPAPVREPGTEFAKPTTVSALDLQPGDCYNAAPLPTDGSDVPIGSVDAVPCTDPHTAQVVATLGYAGQDYTEVVETRAPEDCSRETQARLRPELLADPAYSFGQIHPAAGSWLRSPSIACIVATVTPTTGSALL